SEKSRRDRSLMVALRLEFLCSEPMYPAARSRMRPRPRTPFHMLRRSPHVAAVVTLALIAVAPLAPSPRPAPPFSVKTLEGKPLKSSDLRQKPVIVDFWATWCAPCRASMPHLSSMQTRYEKQGLTVVGLSVDESGPQSVKQFANKLGVKFTLAMAN